MISLHCVYSTLYKKLPLICETCEKVKRYAVATFIKNIYLPYFIRKKYLSPSTIKALR